MKYILTIFCFMSVMFSSTVERYYKELKNLSDTQKIALVEFYVYGQDYGYDEILAAIAWKESSLCTQKISSGDGTMGSYGCMQVQLYYDLKVKKADMKKKTINTVKNMHINNNTYNAHAAIHNLNKWKERHGGNIRHILASYNAGTKGLRSPIGAKYAEDILIRSKAIKKYLQTSGIGEYIDAMLKQARAERKDTLRYSRTKVLAMN